MDVTVRNISYLLHKSSESLNPIVEARMLVSALSMLIGKIEKDIPEDTTINLKFKLVEVELSNKSSKLYKIIEKEISSKRALCNFLTSILHSLVKKTGALVWDRTLFIPLPSQTSFISYYNKETLDVEIFRLYTLVALGVRYIILTVLSYFDWDKIEFAKLESIGEGERPLFNKFGKEGMFYGNL